MLPVLVAIIIGAGLPMQTAINSRLRSALGSPMRSSLASFAVGTIALVAVLLLTGEGFGLSGDLLAFQPWWVWIGGVLGVAFLTGNIVLFPHLGGVRTVILPILGQILMGDVIDVLGLFGLPVRALTWRLVAGTLLAVAGMMMAVASGASAPRSGQDSSADSSGAVASGDAADEALRSQAGRPSDGRSGAATGRSAGLVLWSVVGVLLGTLSAMQTAANGELGIRMGSAVRASVVSFVTGTALLALLVGAEGIWRISRKPSTPPCAGGTHPATLVVLERRSAWGPVRLRQRPAVSDSGNRPDGGRRHGRTACGKHGRGPVRAVRLAAQTRGAKTSDRRPRRACGRCGDEAVTRVVIFRHVRCGCRVSSPCGFDGRIGVF